MRWCLHKDFDAENCPEHTLGQLWSLNRIGYPLLQRLLPVISMTLRVPTFEASTRHQGFCRHPQHILSVGFLPAIAWLLCPQNLRWIFVNMARICKGLASTTYSTKQCLGVRVESTNSWVCTCCSLKNVWLCRQRKLQCVKPNLMRIKTKSHAVIWQVLVQVCGKHHLLQDGPQVSQSRQMSPFGGRNA